MSAAKAARCAGDQGKFWEMRHHVLINNAQLNPSLLTTLAGDLKLEMRTFQDCTVAMNGFDADIKKDIAAASSVGVSGTPSFVIGRMASGGLEGLLVVGAQPYAVFDARIKEMLEPRH
jgi:protein-disulfide isomerase